MSRDQWNKLKLDNIPTKSLEMWLAMYQDFVRQTQGELDKRANPELNWAVETK